MRTTDPGDAARIELLLAELRLPAVKQVWLSLAAQADKEGWPAGRFLAALAEHEIAERGRRRLERHLAEARLPPGKTLDTFDFEAVPVVSKAQVMALAAGDAWLNNGANLLLFGPPGGGKSHLAAALGFALVENGWRVLGGINWSSQHNREECCDGRETAVGSSITGQVEVARAAGDGAT
jgi:DNA replication protein DnaC